MTDTNIRVLKRSGLLEDLDYAKLHRVITWAAEGLDVSVSQVELKAHIELWDGIPTRDIHRSVVRAARELITKETPDYQYLAARLAMFYLRKDAYGDFTPPPLKDHLKKLTDSGHYDPVILESYSEEELDLIDGLIDHTMDMDYSYAAVNQFESKYLVKHRGTGQVFETPQFSFILIPMALHAKVKDKSKRMEYISDFYTEIKNKTFSLPTPIMSGLRTPTRQFSSCVLIECGDTLDSINATNNSIVKYISRKAGIGFNFGRIRALGTPIRGGEAISTGVIPFLKTFQASTKSCSQGLYKAPHSCEAM